MVGVGAAPLWLQRAAFAGRAARARRKKVLVAIFQRGAADGLNIVVPHGEQRYYDLRPTICDSAAFGEHRGRRCGDRSGRLLRAASVARAAEAACGSSSTWRSCMPPVRPIRRVRISMRRIIWNRARRV